MTIPDTLNLLWFHRSKPYKNLIVFYHTRRNSNNCKNASTRAYGFR